MQVATSTTAAATEGDPRWAAVLARSPEADGRFVYAVRTTGVYCRPSCAARRARPGNVGFYAGPAAAEAAGYRACKRCRPNRPAPPDPQAAAVARACRLIESAETPPSLQALADAAGLSRHHFHRLFKAATGLTPRGYAAAHRQRRLREALPGAATVTDAIYAAGYNAPSRFYAEAGAVLGMTPTGYRSGGAEAEIHFAIGQCSLGAILVARSARGICAILLGDEPAPLLAQLQDRLPHARLLGGDAGFEAVVAAVIGLVEAPGLGLALPLDIRGTAFQQRVWQALRDIPAGQTASYAEVARRLQLPRAVRAVAAACAANSLAVAIPCHRVVRSDGGLAGYRWGIARKRALLDREAIETKL